MRKAIIILVCIFSILAFPSIAFDNYSGKENITFWNQYTVKGIIDYYADKYNQDQNLLEKVAECESNYAVDKFGDNGYAFSVFQIHKETFEEWSKEMGEELDYDSYLDNIKISAWAFSQGESYRDKWTSYLAIKNGGVFSFYSALLNQHFTVYCKL